MIVTTPWHLTLRESEVLYWIAQGKVSKEIANLLDLSPYTIDVYRYRAMKKLNLHNAAQVTIWVLEELVNEDSTQKFFKTFRDKTTAEKKDIF